MPTIDLSTPPPPPTGLLDALPRRVALTLSELRTVAERAGGAPLPFDVVEPGRLATPSRAGSARAAPPREDSAYADGHRVPARPDGDLGATGSARTATAPATA